MSVSLSRVPGGLWTDAAPAGQPASPSLLGIRRYITSGNAHVEG